MRFLRFFTLLSFTITFLACTDDVLAPVEELTPTTTFLVDHNEDGHVHNLPDLDLEEPIQRHVDGHSVNFDELELVTVSRPDGTIEEKYLLDGDIELTKAELQELRRMDAAMEKQYRTYNLVSIQTIDVLGYTGGNGNALTSRMRTALQWAVNNYNALNINKNFKLTFGTNTNGKEIVVYRQPNEPGAGGRAGFPSGGLPFKWVQIYKGMDTYDTNTMEHVITHEIGHSMGLRHTDYFSRQSCGQTGEPANPDGAVKIPGTPSGFDPNSVMLSCFGSGEDGEFGFYDRVALEYLY